MRTIWIFLCIYFVVMLVAESKDGLAQDQWHPRDPGPAKYGVWFRESCPARGWMGVQFNVIEFNDEPFEIRRNNPIFTKAVLPEPQYPTSGLTTDGKLQIVQGRYTQKQIKRTISRIGVIQGSRLRDLRATLPEELNEGPIVIPQRATITTETLARLSPSGFSSSSPSPNGRSEVVRVHKKYEDTSRPSVWEEVERSGLFPSSYEIFFVDHPTSIIIRIDRISDDPSTESLQVFTLAFSPDSTFFTFDTVPPWKTEIEGNLPKEKYPKGNVAYDLRIFDTKTRKTRQLLPRGEFYRGTDRNRSVEWSRDSKLMAFRDYDYKKRRESVFWAERTTDTKTQDETMVIRGQVAMPPEFPEYESCGPIVWSPSGRYLLGALYDSSGGQRTLHHFIAMPSEGSEVWLLDPPDPPRFGNKWLTWMDEPSFSPDEKYILARGQADAPLWNNGYILWAPVDGSKPFSELIPRTENDCLWGAPQWLEIDKLPLLPPR